MKQEQQAFTLSNGVVVKTSERDNQSGYLGAAFSPAWTLNIDLPFVVSIGRPKELNHILKIRKGGDLIWQGGYYADAREAAYVTALFKENPVETDEIIYANGGVFVDFPSDLYDLPVFLDKTEANKLITDYRIANPKEVNSNTTKKPVIKKDKPVNSVWKDIYEKYNIPELAKKFGKDAIVTARNTLTVSEFELRFCL